MDKYVFLNDFHLSMDPKFVFVLLISLVVICLCQVRDAVEEEFDIDMTPNISHLADAYQGHKNC